MGRLRSSAGLGVSMSFIQELKRRSVIRVGAAYLVVAWLLIQVIDTLQGMLRLPDWVGPFSLIALAVGFPITLFLAWAYELTPEGIRSAEDVEAEQPVARFGGRKIDFVIIGALSMVIVLLILKGSLLPPAPPDDVGIPTVQKYTQLTPSHITFPPFESPYPLVADNSRLYFNDFDSAVMRVRELAQAGGEAVPFDMRWDKPGASVRPTTMTPDKSGVVMTSVHLFQRDPQLELWSFPVVGGAPRKLGEGVNAVFSRDGGLIAYVEAEPEIRLILANADMTEKRELLTVTGHIYWIDFSPDGKRLRYGVWDNHRVIWEVSVDGKNAHPILPEWQSIEHCCGSWTPDGEYYVFQAEHDNRVQLWAIRESGGSTSEPVQITSAALDFRRPTIAADGKSIFAIGWQLRGEVVRFDSDVGQFTPFREFEGISAEWFSYSRDGQKVAYISYPERDIWRSNSDGTDRAQLTFDPMGILGVTMSPDGHTIAFIGVLPDKSRQIYIVPYSGGTPEPMTPENSREHSPAWSPDSSKIAFTRPGSDKIVLYDVDSGSISEMPGSEGLYYPDWSPDGRYIAAWTPDNAVMALDVHTGQRIELLGPDVQIQVFYWANDSEHIFFVDRLEMGREGAVHRLNIADKSTEKIASLGRVRGAVGLDGVWIGIDPGGAPIMLRDVSIHNIYELDWLR